MNIFNSGIGLLLILFAVLMVPKLPLSITNIVNNLYFKLLFIIVIILLANKHFTISLICLIIFFIIINKLSIKEIMNKLSNTSHPLQTPIPLQHSELQHSELQLPVQSQHSELLLPVQSQHSELLLPIQSQQLPLPVQSQHSELLLPVQSQQLPLPVQSQSSELQLPVQSQSSELQLPVQLSQIQTVPVQTQLPVQLSQIQTVPVQSALVQTQLPVMSNISITNTLSNNINTDINSILPKSNDITPYTLSIIDSLNSKVDNIILQIKNNYTDYINSSVKSEENLKNQITLNTDKIISQQLNDSINKLLIERNAVSSILNNNNPIINEQLLNSLIKSNLLNAESKKALLTGDETTSSQLHNYELAYVNIINTITQPTMPTLKPLVVKAKNVSFINDTNKHLNSTLNILNYNNHMTASLDAKFNGNIENANKHEKMANQYLQNIISVNDTFKGAPIHSSKNLYAMVDFPNNKLIPENIPQPTRCDDINDINISGYENYTYAEL